MIYASGSGVSQLQPVMIFIDGGYLRKEFNDAMHHENINFTALQFFLRGLVDRGELVRCYYYDANVDPLDDKDRHVKLNTFFDKIKECNSYEVKLGRLIKKGTNSFKQKGVDVLIAIDMITKAYEGQYEIAVLLAGDDDFIDVVKAVKDSGKRVYGVFSEKTVSIRLKQLFDARFILSHDKFDQFTIK